MNLAPLARKRATDEVYDSLRQAILTRVFKPGERLMVEDISRKLGVSLTPVRHALQQLATEGLIEIHPRSGTYVANVSAREIEETFDIRCALECLAAEHAVTRIEPGGLKRLRALLESMSQPVHTAEALQRHERANSEFHQILIEAAGNRRLLEMYESLNAHIKIARIHSAEHNIARQWQGRLADEQAEHEAIVAALETGDAAALKGALRRHIMRAKRALGAALRSMDESAPGPASER
jgi:DNA-binding GntR family transcriptional regulator